MVQRVAFGVPSPHVLPKLRDLDRREMAALIPLVVLVFWIGVFPNPMLTRMHASVKPIIARALPTAPAPATAMSRSDRFVTDSGDPSPVATEAPSP
jgi:NADH-quinone oxidoreductase subunit M